MSEKAVKEKLWKSFKKKKQKQTWRPIAENF